MIELITMGIAYVSVGALAIAIISVPILLIYMMYESVQDTDILFGCSSVITGLIFCGIVGWLVMYFFGG